MYIWIRPKKMETIRIDILNPKAKDLLKNLASMDLIKIREDDRKVDLDLLLEKLRSKSEDAPSLEEIEREVEIVRSNRYGK
jgi:hypothetical protein